MLQETTEVDLGVNTHSDTNGSENKIPETDFLIGVHIGIILALGVLLGRSSQQKAADVVGDSELSSQGTTLTKTATVPWVTVDVKSTTELRANWSPAGANRDRWPHESLDSPPWRSAASIRR